MQTRDAFFFHAQAMLAVLLIEDDAEFDREFDYLMDLFGKAELFVETASWDWLKRHQYLLQSA